MTTTKKETGLVPQQPGEIATTDAVPRALAGAIQPEEWAAMSAEERQQAIAFFKDEAAETTKGVSLSFPRIKYPTSGASFWEVPTAEGDAKALKEIEGVIVFKQPVRAWWPPSADVGNNPPSCASRDGVVPDDLPDKQAETCAACPQSKWGSAIGKDGKPTRGQACKARLNVFVTMDGQEIPYLISLPPTSLEPFGKFAVQLRQGGIPLVGVTTVFSLTDEKNATGTAYKGLALRIGRRLSFKEAIAAKTMRDAFQAQMERRGIVVEEAREPEETPGSNGHAASGGQVIDAVVTGTDKAAGF